MIPKKKKINKFKTFNIIAIIINVILFIGIGLLSYLILKNDILPNKYLIIYFLLVGLIPLGMLFFLFFKKTKFKIKIALAVVDILFIIIVGLLVFYLHGTIRFIDNFTTSSNYVTRNYMVLVPKESEYQDIKELDKKNIGYIELNAINYTQAFGELNKLITFENKDYLDYKIMFEALKLNEIDAFLTSDTYYEILGEEVENLSLDYHVIYTFSIKEKAVDVKKDVDVTEDVFNVYISGLDTYSSISKIARSDVNIVVSINPKTYQILMVNIPRDYYVTFHGQTKRDKLTHAGLYGTEMSIKTIEDLLDIDINYYLKVNFNSVIGLVDALGGVDVYSEYSFISAGNGYYFQKGFNHVNGQQALDFSRTRKVLPGGDRVRGQNQQAMIQAIIKKITSPAIITRYTSILASLEDSFLTNMSTDKITDIVKMQLDKSPKWNITSISLDGADSNDYTSVFPDKKVYVMEPYEETITKAKETLKSVRDGVKLESSYQDNTSGYVSTPFIPKPEPKPVEPEEEQDQTEEQDSNTDLEQNEDSDNSDNQGDDNQDGNTDIPNIQDKEPSQEETNDSNNSGSTEGNKDLEDDNTKSEDNNNQDDSKSKTENDTSGILDIPGIVN